MEEPVERSGAGRAAGIAAVRHQVTSGLRPGHRQIAVCVSGRMDRRRCFPSVARSAEKDVLWRYGSWTGDNDDGTPGWLMVRASAVKEAMWY